MFKLEKGHSCCCLTRASKPFDCSGQVPCYRVARLPSTPGAFGHGYRPLGRTCCRVSQFAERRWLSWQPGSARLYGESCLCTVNLTTCASSTLLDVLPVPFHSTLQHEKTAPEAPSSVYFASTLFCPCVHHVSEAVRVALDGKPETVDPLHL